MNKREVMDWLNAGKRVTLKDILTEDLNGIHETRESYQQGYVSRKKLYRDLEVYYSRKCKSLYYLASCWETSYYCKRVYFNILEPKAV